MLGHPENYLFFVSYNNIRWIKVSRIIFNLLLGGGEIAIVCGDVRMSVLFGGTGVFVVGKTSILYPEN